MEFALDTYLNADGLFGEYTKGRALCSDGKVRALIRIDRYADTYFSVPATVQVRGKKVRGYATVEPQYGRTYMGGDWVVKFVRYDHCVNAKELPPGTYKGKIELPEVDGVETVICSDGKVRKLQHYSERPDYHFGNNAAVHVNRKTVSGYVTVDGLFVAYGKNEGELPPGPYKKEIDDATESSDMAVETD